ncbi:hypothetical protein Lfu02_28910 [Longispora fulva]|uniref:Secreted protein n=1 Tax=Longispora fulva TaxID=619741 RepID=A0A8J7KMD5_9ACTN|nr:hypothetical protein [Longispora fulva]MBG6139026.1 hypothetical protein [Longispora fulva]GIG58519.1 hypothetical protein Lfu02_28910 [Longispora fulva]
MTSSPPVRLGVFIGGLSVALLSGFLIGKVAGPKNVPASASPHVHGTSTAAAGDGHTHGGTTGDATGLAISSLGYTLVPGRAELVAGEGGPFTFTIVGPGGKVVTEFAQVHEQKLHMIVVRRDLSGYQHVHPTMRADGTWELPLTLREPGSYRMFADFTTNAIALVLGADLTVAGSYTPTPLPAAAREAKVGGLDVTYEGTPRIGASQPLMFRVFTAGAPVSNLERYLGAYGHLIIVREGDVGYVHAHPEPELSGGAIKFWFTAPGPGRYRAFLDFQVGGTVRTAEFTVVV